MVPLAYRGLIIFSCLLPGNGQQRWTQNNACRWCVCVRAAHTQTVWYGTENSLTPAKHQLEAQIAPQHVQSHAAGNTERHRQTQGLVHTIRTTWYKGTKAENNIATHNRQKGSVMHTKTISGIQRKFTQRHRCKHHMYTCTDIHKFLLCDKASPKQHWISAHGNRNTGSRLVWNRHT